MSEASIEYARQQLARQEVSPGLNWTPAGGGQFIGGGPSNVPGGTSQPGAPAPAVYTPPPPQPEPEPDGRFPSPAAPPPPAAAPAVDTGMLAYVQFLREQEAARQRELRATATSFLAGILEQYGMGSLSSQIETLINEWGTNTGVIAEKLRQTSEYQTRFKGLVGLQKRGITDIRNEAQYIELESNYRAVFREAGLRDFLGQSGTQAEYDAIANLVSDFSLSVNEVRSRVMDAQRVAADAPQEVRDALQRFYNVNAQDLVAYSLDPQRTMTRINEKANAAILGGYAARAGLDIGVGAAERVVGLAGAEDISLEGVQRSVAEAREVRDATRRLAEIERGILTDEEVLTAQAGVAPESAERIRTLQSRERARFGGSGAFGSRGLAQARSV